MVVAIVIDDLHGHADFHFIRRAIDDVADQAETFVEVDQRNVVRNLVLVRGMPGA